MMYASKITIQRTPKTIHYCDTYDLDLTHSFTLKELRNKFKVTEDDKFFVQEAENSSKSILYVQKKRLETEKELAERIAKEEAYNSKYEEFHRRYGRKSQKPA